MKSKLFVLIANLIVVGVVSLFVLLLKDFKNGQQITAFIFLLLTLLTPTIYTYVSSLTLKDKSLSNVLWLSLIPTGIFFIVNTIACAILMAINNLSWKALTLTEVLIVGVYAIFLVVALMGSNYIKKINKEK